MTDTAILKGSAAIGNDGIKKHFKGQEPWQPLFELIWNGFDATATMVSVTTIENNMEGLEKVMVLDDGIGIKFDSLEQTFGRFNDSIKKGDFVQKGEHGRGRLAFHLLCQNASWFTKTKDTNLVIHVDTPTIKDFIARRLEENEQIAELLRQATGTLVELTNFTKMLPHNNELRAKLSVEFGWYLVVHSQKQIHLNGISIEIPTHEEVKEDIEVDGTIFHVQMMRWEQKPTSEKSYLYLLSSSGVLVYKALSSLNQKPNFFTSICVTSAWADTFSKEKNLLNPHAHTLSSSTWRKFITQLDQLNQRVYSEFLRRRAEEVLQGYEREGYFPSYSGLDALEQEWRHQHVRGMVQSIYIADPRVFQSASKKQIKLIIRLLDRLAVSNENDALLDVLDGALDLDAKAVQSLANQLRRSSFENIISSIEVLQRRASTIQQLRHIMNEHYLEVLETPDLQKIIEHNTWLFGPRYETLGAEEDSFTKIAQRLRNKAMSKSDVDIEDVTSADELDGAMRQPDLFLARKFPTFDSSGKQIYRCIVVEIKRPSISLNKKHLRQLEDYADIIKSHPEFTSERMHFELILVGRKISSTDTQINSRVASLIPRGEQGLVSDEARMKLYVMNWYTLLDGFDLTYDFMLDKLKLKRDDYSTATKEDLVAELQTGH